MKKKEEGAIIVEATIALTSFIFFIYILLTIVNVCLAQAKIGIAVNAAAKELSQYCYLYSLTGIEKVSANLEGKGELSDGVVDNVADGIETLYDEIGNMAGGNSSVGSVKNSATSAYNSLKSGATTIADDPKQFMMSMIFATTNDLFQMGKNSVGAMLVKNLVQKNLRANTEGTSLKVSVESFLRYCGVVPGGNSYIDGLDFGATEIMPQGAENNLVIKIVADYDIRFVRLLNLDLTVHLNACGATQAWAVGDTPTSKSFASVSTGGEGNSQSEDSQETDKEDEDKPIEPKTTKPPKEYSKELTKNPNADMVFIGSDADNAGSNNDATYLDSKGMKEAEAEIGQEGAWEIQKTFMQGIIDSKKRIYLTDDPYKATGDAKKQIQYLKDHGYKIIEAAPYCYAEPKTRDDL